MLLLLALFIVDFAQLIVPHAQVPMLTAAVKYPLTLLLAGAGLCLHVLITRKYHRIPAAAGIVAGLLPTAAYLAQLALRGPASFIVRVDADGPWTWEVPSRALDAYMLVIVCFTLLNASLAYRAWRRSDARFDRNRFLILIRTDLIFLGTFIATTSIGSLVRLHAFLPSTYTLLPGLVWGLSIGFMMINADFLPRPIRRYEVLFRMSPAPILILDGEARIREANPKAKEMFGLGEGGRGVQALESFFIPEDRGLFRDMYLPQFPNIYWQGKEMAMRGKDGQLISVLLDMEMMAENGEPYGLAIIRDITQRKNVERQTDYLAHHDVLTGFCNRSAFKKALVDALAAKSGASTFDAVLLVDLDRFKLINDTLGHQCGDDVLKVIAARFRECLDEGTLLARAGGDEFMILVRGAAEYDAIIRIAEKVQHALESPSCCWGPSIT